MVEKHNYYENRLYTSTGAGEKAGSNAIPDWKQPLNFLRWLVQFVKNPAGAARQLAAGDRHSLKTGNKRGIINTGTTKLKLKAQQPTGMETSFS